MAVLEFGAENWIFVVGLICVLGMTYGIGANDVANSMGIPIGAGVLTLKLSIILASSAELSGALLLGDQVSNTLRNNVIYSDQWEDYPSLLAIGFTAALFGTTLWLVVASLLKMPVSTTHSIVGAVIGFALVQEGSSGVQWDTLASIVAAWFISPVLGALVAGILYWITAKLIVKAADPEMAAKSRLWVFFSLVAGTLWIFMAAKLDIPGMSEAIEYIGAIAVALLAAFLFQFCILRFLEQRERRTKSLLGDDHEESEKFQEVRVQGTVETGAEESGSCVQSPLLVEGHKNIQRTGESGGNKTVIESPVKTPELEEISMSPSPTLRPNPSPEQEFEARYHIIRMSFSGLLILSSWLLAFAHGANDVSNAIGPFAAINSILETGTVDSEEGIPYWVLLIGGIGLCLGLSTLGYLVMGTVGNDIMVVTTIKGFCIQYGTAVTILLASFLGLPVSTTHTLIGAVLGVGAVSTGRKSINFGVVKKIIISWLVTIPCAALPTVLFFLVARTLTGPYDDSSSSDTTFAG